MLTSRLKSAVIASAANYIEDVFSTYLYTGTSANRSITNDIDLAGKGGLVWIKTRSEVWEHYLADTVRGTSKALATNNTSPENTGLTNAITSFNSNGFSLGIDTNLEAVNRSPKTYVSWTFREQAKFFDVVTYTGNGANRTISHNLGSVPGTIIIKRTDTTSAWAVYHRSLANTEYMVLNTTAAKATGATYWNSTTPTSTVFSLGTATDVNANAGTYVAYLFAHDAGGFGASGTDNVISCGSYVGNTTTPPFINCGFEPQWVLVRAATTTSDWLILDNMRGVFTGSADEPFLNANTSGAESANLRLAFNATGFTPEGSGTATNAPGQTHIYIAIRRGPMKTPTSGTSVFGLSARTGTGANATVTGGQIDDAVLIKNRGSAVASLFSSRLTGTGYLVTSTTAAEVAAGTTILQANPWDVMNGVKVGTTSTITNASANTFINYLFRRAPGFMDVVCYTGNATTNVVAHNLRVVPEFIIIKSRSSTTEDWGVYCLSLSSVNLRQSLNLTDALFNQALFGSTPTTTQLSFSTSNLNQNGSGYVAYLFATLAGVSKVGSYTGNGSSQTIACGFTAGARFILIKRTNSTGDWYVWDTARGIVSGNDPHLSLNTTAAEVTTNDTIDPDNSGFIVNQVAATNVNVNAATYIFLAIA